MTYIKIIFLLVMAMLERCHVIKKNTIPRQRVTLDTLLLKSDKDLTGSWRIADISDSKLGPQTLSSLKSPANGSIFSFFRDSTFTEVHATGYYRHGTYKLQLPDSTLQLKVNGKIDEIKLAFAPIEGRRMMRMEKPGEIKTLAEYAYPLRQEKEDPFYPANNQWRIKPAVAQSEKQIREKIQCYLKHNCYILRAAQHRNQSVVSWEYSDGIIEMYNGSIGIVPLVGIPKSWSETFYNPEDARKGYRLFQRYLHSGHFKGRLTGKWVQDNYNILNHVLEASQRDETHQASNR